MFDDFYVRLPFDRLARERYLFLKQKIRPELFISTTSLGRLSAMDIHRSAKAVSAFASHTLHAPFMDISPGAQDEDIRALSFAKMRKIMEIAAEWGSRLVVMHFNYDPVYYRHHFEDWLHRAADFFLRLLETKTGAFIALENVADPTPYVAMRLAQEVNDPRIIHCLDLGHHHVFAEIPLGEWLFYLNPQRHIHFHFHDNDGSEDDHQPLGRGTIDWRSVRRALENLACPFSLGLEPHNAKDMRHTLKSYRESFL